MKRAEYLMPQPDGSIWTVTLVPITPAVLAPFEPLGEGKYSIRCQPAPLHEAITEQAAPAVVERVSERVSKRYRAPKRLGFAPPTLQELARKAGVCFATAVVWANRFDA